MACIAKRRGRYVIDFYDTHGKRRWVTLPKGSTKKKATEKMREIEDQLIRGIYLPARKVPTFEMVSGDWLEHKKQNVRKSTWDGYSGHLEHHFKDINPMRINQITPAKVERFISGKQTKGMNLTTLRRVLVTFNQVMKYAVRHRYIDHNPVRDAERPRGQGGEKEQHIRVLTPSEISTFLDAIENRKMRTLFLLAVMSGARQGELFGLKWSDVDWESRQIHIKRTFNKGHWYSPKSSTSNRKVDLGPETMSELRKWRMACPSNDLDLIFPSEAGTPLDHGNVLRQYFYPALKKAGIPRIRFHDLRHCYASLLIEQGENVKYIQTQLGHASPTVTLNVYAHLLNPSNQEAPRRLEKAILKATGSKVVAEKEKGSTATAATP